MECCDRILEVVNIIVVPGVSVTLNVVPTQEFLDHGVYKLEIPQALPEMIGTEPVSIAAGTNTFYCVDHAADILRAGKLRGHRCGRNAYRIVFGADGVVTATGGAHFEFLCGLSCMRFSSAATLFNPLSVTDDDNTVKL